MNNIKQDAARCTKINALIAAARRITVEQYRDGLCPTCARRAYDAYFRCDARGYGVEGCVDAFHHGHHASAERQRWFSRPAAQQIRADALRDAVLISASGGAKRAFADYSEGFARAFRHSKR